MFSYLLVIDTDGFDGKFLHDVGERYLNESEFKELLIAKFHNVNFSKFRNIAGNYMIADIWLTSNIS